MTNTNCDVIKSKCIVCSVPVGSKLQYKCHLFDNHSTSNMEADLKVVFDKAEGKCSLCERDKMDLEVFSKHLMLDHDKVLDYMAPGVKEHVLSNFESSQANESR